MKAGLEALLPCRFQEFVHQYEGVSVTCVLDIAHNTAAMESLVRRVKHKYPTSRYRFVMYLTPQYVYLCRRVVFGMSADKDVIRCAEILKTLVEDAAHVHCVAVRGVNVL